MPEDKTETEQAPLSRRVKTLRLLLVLAVVALLAGLTAMIAVPLLRYVSEPEHFQHWMRQTGVWGVLAFALMGFLQVFAAVVPGGPFAVAAGYAYGPVLGTAICVAANSLASVLLVALVRRFGPAMLYFLTGKTRDQLRPLPESRHLGWILLGIFLVPSTPKDVIGYAVGFTRLPLWQWLLINLIGRIPGVAVSAFGGGTLVKGQYGLALGLAAAAALIYGGGALLYRRWLRKNGSEPRE